MGGWVCWLVAALDVVLPHPCHAMNQDVVEEAIQGVQVILDLDGVSIQENSRRPLLQDLSYDPLLTIP